jgi:hypothetical protein
MENRADVCADTNTRRILQMTNDEQPTPDQTGTWEPDWEHLTQARLNAVIAAHESSSSLEAVSDSLYAISAKAVIADYRRQQDEHGIVEVPWEFLVTMRNITQKYPPDGSIEMVTDVLTRLLDRHDAATEQDR